MPNYVPIDDIDGDDMRAMVIWCLGLGWSWGGKFGHLLVMLECATDCLQKQSMQVCTKQELNMILIRVLGKY